MENAKLGISLERDYPTSTFLKATCDCMGNHHDHNLIVEYDKELGFVSIQIHTDVSYCDWYAEDKNLFIRMWSRIRNAAKLLFTGYLEMDSEFIFSESERGRNYAKAILEAMDELEKRNKKPLST